MKATMKFHIKLSIALLIGFTCIAFAQETPKTAAPKQEQTIKLPAATMTRIQEAQRQLQELELRKQTIQLQIEVALKDAFLELGLSKAQLDKLQLTSDKDGALVLVPKDEKKK